MRATIDYGIHYSRCTLNVNHTLTVLDQVIEHENVLEAKGETQKCRHTDSKIETDMDAVLKIFTRLMPFIETCACTNRQACFKCQAE